MTIDTAQFVVQRAGVQLKCTGADLATKLQAGDLMAVTRPSDDTYKWVIPATPIGLELTINTEQVTPGNATWGIFTQTNYNGWPVNTPPEGFIDWGDGTTGNLEDSFQDPIVPTTWTLEHTYSAPGIYTVKATAKGFLSVVGAMSGDTINTNYANMITAYGPPDADYEFSQAQYMNMRMSNIGSENIDSFDWSNVVLANSVFALSGIPTFPAINFASATSLSGAWSQCPNLASFGEIQIPNATTLTSAWQYCSKLTSFPLLNTGSVKNLASAWLQCTGLTSFPLIDSSNVTNFSNAWFFCQGLTSFPALNYSSGTNFDTAWNGNYQLSDFPPNAFDSTGVLLSNAFNKSFSGCAFTISSVENILVSLDTNGQLNIALGINQGTNAGKSTWTAAANTAYDNLIAKGWSITFNA